MKIAIVGGGISGMTAGYHLHKQHEISLFESGSYIGGHTNTISVEENGRQLSVDTGFIVFNDRTYPNFIRMLEKLDVKSQPTRMSFSVSCEKTGLEYRGADFDGLFAQRRNVLNPRYLRLLWEIAKFNRIGQTVLESGNDEETVNEFFERIPFTDNFLEQYFLPMGSAIWSASFETFGQFPIRFICEFYKNHGLLGLTDRPQWRVICGGSREYIKPLTENWSDRISLNSAVVGVERRSGGVALEIARADGNRSSELFDHVIFACHSDQSLRILGNSATAVEREVLSAFPYQENEAILHTQDSVLPNNRRAWACWNYYRPEKPTAAATVTYNMNILQSLNCDRTYCVTLNDNGRIRDENVIRTIRYAHPTFDSRRKKMQDRHRDLIDLDGISYCGAYWGNGFHEDGVVSALAVIRQLERTPQYV